MTEPSTAPMLRLITMARYHGTPPSMSRATLMPASAATLPTDRSMPATRITKVMPIAVMPTTLDC